MREPAVIIGVEGDNVPGMTLCTQASVLSPSWSKDNSRRLRGLQLSVAEKDFADISIRRLGPVHMSRCTLTTGAIDRMEPGTRSGRLTLMLPVCGEITVEQDAGRATAGAGDLVLVDGRRPYLLAMSAPVTFAALQTDRHLLGLLDSTVPHLTAQQWSAAGGLRTMPADVFASLSSNLAEIDGSECETLGLTVISLMTGLFIDGLRTKAANPAVSRQILLLRMLTHIRDLLGDATLTPTRVANNLEISLRHVQALFAELGTSPAKWIRDERLARLHADLLNPCFDNFTVASLGESWGLVGASRVSRLFRARYGHTPSEVRRKRWAWTNAQALRRVTVSASEIGLEHLNHLQHTHSGGACAY